MPLPHDTRGPLGGYLNPASAAPHDLPRPGYRKWPPYYTYARIPPAIFFSGAGPASGCCCLARQRDLPLRPPTPPPLPVSPGRDKHENRSVRVLHRRGGPRRDSPVPLDERQKARWLVSAMTGSDGVVAVAYLDESRI
jgi:hypothetical protein